MCGFRNGYAKQDFRWKKSRFMPMGKREADA
jgi:hypothetical protein